MTRIHSLLSWHSPVRVLLTVKGLEITELVPSRNGTDLGIAPLFVKRDITVLKPLAQHFE